jgi:hypothetical protein
MRYVAPLYVCLSEMPDRTEPQIVRLGVLTHVEFDDLSPQEQVEVEATTAYLVKRYGVAAFMNDRKRHRADIWLAYGVCELPQG